MSIIKLILSPKGELKRGKFILGIFLAYLILLAFLFAPSSLDFLGSSTANLSALKLMRAMSFLLGLLFILYSQFCLGVKRLRDMGMSAWFVIILYIPYLHVLALLLLMVYPSKKIKN